MPNYAAKKTPGASSQLINDWKSPVDSGSGKPISLSMFYKRVGFIGSFRAGFQCLDQADAVLSTVWHTTVDNAGSTTDAAYVSYSAINLDVVAGTYFIRFLIEVGVSGSTAHSAGDVYFDNTNLYEMEIPNLDLVRDGSTFSKVNNTNITAGNITSVYRDSGIRPVADFINKALDTVDDVPDGVTYAKVKAANLSGGDVSKIIKGAGFITGDDLFELGVDTMDSVQDGTTYARVKTGNLTSGDITRLKNGAGFITTSDVMDKSVDTVDAILDGTTFKKIKAISVSGGEVSQLIDGQPFRAYDTLDGRQLAALASSLSGVTNEFTASTDTYDVTVASASTDPRFTTGLKCKQGATHVLVRYKCSGSWPQNTYTARIFGLTSSATADATVITTSNLTRTLLFALSGFTTDEELRFEPINSDLPLGSACVMKISQISVGTPGIGDREESYTAFSFTSGWEDYDDTTWEPAGYRLDSMGYVCLKGLVRRVSGASTTIGTLPVGYRPALQHMFATDSNNAHGRIDVYPDGTVVLTTGSPTSWCSLAGIRFRIR